jgi:hypothetical protein
LSGAIDDSKFWAIADCQEPLEKGEAVRMKAVVHWIKGDDGKPFKGTIRWVIDSHNNMYMEFDSLEQIVVDGFLYSREGKTAWSVASAKTMEAIYSGLPDWMKLRKEPALTKLVEDDNLKHAGFAFIKGRKTARYRSINSVTMNVGDDTKASVSAVQFMSVSDHRVRKLTLRFSALNSGELLGVLDYFWSYPRHLIIRAPRLPEVDEDPYKGHIIFNFARCVESPAHPCQRNEMIISWDTQHIGNAVGAVLTRQQAGQRIKRFGVFRQTNGNISDVLCDYAIYRIKAIDRRGRSIPGTKDKMMATRSNLLQCR